MAQARSGDRGHGGLLVWLARSGSLALGIQMCGCGDSIGWNEHIDSDTSSLLGATSYVNCTSGEVADLIGIMDWGRHTSRSHAFVECVDRAMRQEVYMGAWTTEAQVPPVFRGPYYPCGAGTYQSPTSYDPLYNATIERQIARVLNVTASPFDLRHRCDDPCASGNACMGGIDGFQEVVNWNVLPSSWQQFDSGVLWHENVHNHGYHHAAEACGYDPVTYGSNSHAAPNIVGLCMVEVLQRSINNCGLVSSSCATDELYLVDDFDAGAGGCECVPDVLGTNESGSLFGQASSVGDFDSDGLDDLAIGVPGASSAAGAVFLMRGSPTGLKYWRRIDQPDVDFKMFPSGSVGTMVSEANDNFGYSLASADFNVDGYDDLAIGVPGENDSTGFVAILPGTSAGLDPSLAQLVDQAVLGANEAGDAFGYALATGPLDSGSAADLAVGVPQEVYSGSQTGYVMTFRGQANSAASQHFVDPWTGFRDLVSGSTGNDEYGGALAAGDVDANGRYELTVGSPGSKGSNGVAFVREYNGSSFIVESTLVNPYAPTGSRFGASVAIGDFRGSDNPREVVVGAPLENNNTGAVYLFESAASYRQTQYPLGADESGDRFGQSLARASLGVSGYDTLLVGAPGEGFSGGATAGIVFVFDGSSGGLNGRSVLRQADLYNSNPSCPGGSCPPTIIDTYGEAEYNSENFGATLSSGNFNGTGVDDVAASGTLAYVLGDTFSSVASGAVFVFSQDGTGSTMHATLRIDQKSVRYGDVDISQ